MLTNIQTLTIKTFFDASEGKVVEVLDKVIILAAMRVKKVAKAVSVKGLCNTVCNCMQYSLLSLKIQPAIVRITVCNFMD